MKPDLARPLLAVLLLLAPACSSPGGGDSEARAPFPYTPEEIRAANPEGTELLYRVESLGSPIVLRRMTFVAADEEGATLESRTTGLHGEPFGGVDAQYATWKEMREHASFAANATIRTEEACDVAAGHYECWKYVVDEGPAADGLLVQSRFWFARSKPGPPVLMETDRGGVRVFRMELVEERHP